MGEGNAVSFKYRVHDARVGRFLSVDPLAADYPGNSSYAFAENRLTDGIEFEGAEWQPVDANGNDVNIGSNMVDDYVWAGYKVDHYVFDKGAAIDDMPTGVVYSSEPKDGTLSNPAVVKLDMDSSYSLTFYSVSNQSCNEEHIKINNLDGTLPLYNIDLGNISKTDFDLISATIYGEAGYESPDPLESAAIFDVLSNRRAVDTRHRSIVQLIQAGGIYGYTGSDYPIALAEGEGYKVDEYSATRHNSARVGVILGMTGTTDYSGGSYFWDAAVFLNNPRTYSTNFFNEVGNGGFIGTISQRITFDHVKQVGATIFMKYNSKVRPNSTWP